MRRNLLCLAIGLMPAFLLSQEPTVTPPSIQVLKAGEWKTATIQPRDWQGELSATLQLRQGVADLYLRRGAAPTLENYDYKVSGNDRIKTVTVGNTSSPPLTSDVWHIGAHARTTTFYTLTQSVRQVKSQFNGKGAVPFANGTSFRVWAPNANSVHIAGQFNSWSTTQAPLVTEGGGWYSLDYRNARPGQQYKFVIRNGSQTIWKNDPWARQLTSSVGNSVIYDQSVYQWQTNNFQTPAWNTFVVYQMHIGAFNDTPGGGPGTFSTAIAKLDHVRDLGANAIKLLPIQEFPGDFSWGYNPSHLYAVESAYGGPDNLKRFIDEANKRGMAVLLDLVHNHYGPGDLDIWRFDGWSQGPWGGVFFYNDDRAVTPWGNTRPDFGRQAVREYIVENQRQWTNDFRVSGFRWDSVLNMRTTNWGDNPDGWSLLQWLNDDLDANQPWKINIAEDLQNNSWVTRPTSQGGAGFDSQWSNFVHTVRAALKTSDDNQRNMFSIRDAINERFNGNAFQRVVYTESHDENANGKQRVPSEIDPVNPASYWAQKRSTLGAALVMTAPGIPMIFMGQEFLEDGWFADNDPLDWNKATVHAGIVQLYKDLIRLRKNTQGSTAGLTGQSLNTFHVNNSNKVIAFHRWNNGGSGDDVVVVANFRNTTYNNYRIGLPRGGGWSVAFNSDWSGYSSLFGNLFSPNFQADSQAHDGMPFSGTVNLAPYTALILTKD